MEIGRFDVNGCSIVCHKVDNGSYKGFYVSVERGFDELIISTAELEVDSKGKAKETVVCSYLADRDEPKSIIKQTMKDYNARMMEGA